VIGSDLKRLESETLPQYFRHNRFQSLVRQLNFYSFRKINRERNVWIYKHELFHRDRPEDLHLVRRRTCPGLDGRKQRFSRYSARKITDSNSGSEDDSSVEANSTPSSPEVRDVPEVGTKREANDFAEEQEAAKKRKRVMNSEPEVTLSKKEMMVVDTSLLLHASLQAAPEEVDEESSQDARVDERTEMAERAVIVSEVAKKLEQFARKALGPISGKGRRHATGIVTPPFGSRAILPATHLLTYDDEYGENERRHGNIAIVTDGDDSLVSGEDEMSSQSPFATPDSKVSTAVPAGDAMTAQGIADRLSGSIAISAVVNFCVSTSPHGDINIGSKILQLIASCEDLASEFQTYRAALDPFARSDSGSYKGLAVGTPTEVQDMWEREASRSKAVDEFKIFAVNCIHNILGKAGAINVAASLTETDKSILERAVLVWSKTV